MIRKIVSLAGLCDVRGLKLSKFLCLVVLVGALMLPSIALADFMRSDGTFYIGIPNDAMSPYPSPYLRVDVDVFTPGIVYFTVTSLTSSPYKYVFGAEGLGLNFNIPDNHQVIFTDIVGTTWNGSVDTSHQPVSSTNFSELGDMNTAISQDDGYTSALQSLTFTALIQQLSPSGPASFPEILLVDNDRGYFAAAHIFPQDTTDTSLRPIPLGFAGNGVVPVPPSALLLGSGLMGLGILGWRRRRRE